MAFDGIILTGPTASGKSAAALDLASALNGEIINADSMQVYQWLPLLTAQPSALEQTQVPHHFYGMLTNETGSLGWWYGSVCPVIDAVQALGKVPIIVGGTGLYLRALDQGISTIPEIPEAIRQQARSLAATADIYQCLKELDPLVVQSLHPSDTQRLIRAYEVVVATGVSIRLWQQQNHKHRSYSFLKLALVPERERLNERINQRFVAMVEQGALAEVELFLKADIPEQSPIQRAVGLPELKAYLAGAMPLDAAITLAQQSSRQYAKRQLTWLRGQAADYQSLDQWTDEILNQIILSFKNV